jgi:class 3 adenylate cyclase/tetratricopeptide (TPR) repeat protein
MFADIVDSTPLAARLDPEDLHEILQRYQEMSGRVINEHGGHVAQHLGDGLLVYFGYPTAGEDDAQRAVRAGLAMVDELERENQAIQARWDVRLRIRIGIHSGPTVIARTAGGEDETLAFGNTINIAARFQGKAEAGQVVVGEATRRLLRESFELAPMGDHELKGVDAPMPLFQVVGVSSVDRRVRAASRVSTTPIFGREPELEQIRHAFELAQQGQGRAVLLTGDAGIGKSRMVAALHSEFQAQGVAWYESRGLSHRSRAAFHPIVDLMDLALDLSPERGHEDGQRLLAAVAELSPDVAPLFASLLGLSLPGVSGPGLQEPSAQRAALIEAIGEWLQALAADQPLVLVIEDLHWVDPSTLELLERLLTGGGEHLFLLLTARPSFSIGTDEAGHLSVIEIGPLAEQGVSAIAQAVAGELRLPDEVVSLVVERTDGTPLFVEEVVRDLIESGALRPSGEAWAVDGSLPGLAIPASLQDALRSRIDRLGPENELLQHASVLGREFRKDVLAGFMGRSAAEIAPDLQALEDAELVHCEADGEAAAFHHALVRDAAYDGLLKKERRRLHARAGETLADGFPRIADAQPDVVGHHFAQAEHAPGAAVWFERAGRLASGNAALVEAEQHLADALHWLEQSSASRQRDHTELGVRVMLGEAQGRLYGYGSNEMGETFARLGELCDTLDETPPMVLWSQFAFANSRSDRRAVEGLVVKAETLIQQTDDADVLETFHCVLMTNAFYSGDYARFHELAESAWQIRETRTSEPSLRTQEMRREMEGMRAVGAWVTGDAGKGRALMEEALSDAEAFESPYVLTAALDYATSFEINEGNAEPALALAERQLELARKQHFGMRHATGLAKTGWARSSLGEIDSGIAQIEEALQMNALAGHELGTVFLRTLLISSLMANGQLEEARAAHGEAMRCCVAGIESGLLPGLLILGAELHRAEGDLSAAEKAARGGIEHAREQGALMLELRAGLSLATTLAATERSKEAAEILGAISERFPSGADSRTQQHANWMLGNLSG